MSLRRAVSPQRARRAAVTRPPSAPGRRQARTGRIGEAAALCLAMLLRLRRHAAGTGRRDPDRRGRHRPGPGGARAAGAGLLALICTLGPAGPAAAACAPLAHEGRGHVVCSVPAGADLRLWLRDPRGTVWGGFQRLERALAARGERLVFAMNAGMYHADRAPVGLFVGEDGREGRVVTAPGPGNFGMLPNGVFCVGADGFAVIESRAFAQAAPDCRAASQSGPMLVIDGDLHPRFLEGSTSRFVRNGVGVSADGRVAHFVISDRPVSFHEFGRLFRDVLETPQALYFDGNVSRLHAPALGRSDTGRRLGPLVGLVAPAP